MLIAAIWHPPFCLIQILFSFKFITLEYPFLLCCGVVIFLNSFIYLKAVACFSVSGLCFLFSSLFYKYFQATRKKYREYCFVFLANVYYIWSWQQAEVHRVVFFGLRIPQVAMWNYECCVPEKQICTPLAHRTSYLVFCTHRTRIKPRVPHNAEQVTIYNYHPNFG